MTERIHLETDQEKSVEGRYATLVLAIAFTAWLLTNLDQSLFGYVVPQIRDEFGLSLSGISYIISLSFIAGMVLPIGVGVLTDTIGARWTLPLCLGTSAVLVGVQGLVPGLFGFAASRIASFGLSAALSPITSSIVLAASPLKWRAMSVAVLQCAYPLGWLLSSLIVSPLIDQLGWRTLFLVGFLIAPIAVVLGYFLPKNEFGARRKIEKVEHNEASLPIIALFNPAHRRKTILCACAFFFNAGAVAATAFYLPTFLNEVRGYSLANSALIVGSGYGISVIGYLGSAAVGTYLLSRRKTIILWNILAAVFVTTMLWLPQTFWQDFIAFAVMGIFFYGTSAILITYVLENFPEEMRATAAAVCGTACVSGSMAVFPVLVAELVPSLGWQTTFTIIVPPALLISALAITLMPRMNAEGSKPLLFQTK
ncbi:MFS transporter [uncultured Parasphingorhabdus sp.]|uniref:MFS transporter n=1 Tax=uncultured Parasphingorhabdus sp. TaxID=2709694 RepID=UPI0030D7415F